MNDTRRSADAPVSLDEMAAALDGSALVRAARRLLSPFAGAAAESRAAGMITDLRTMLAEADQALFAAGFTLVVAMAVHMLLLAVQPYPYPGSSTFWLPALLFATGALMIVFRRSIAAAWRDRAERGR